VLENYQQRNSGEIQHKIFTKHATWTAHNFFTFLGIGIRYGTKLSRDTISMKVAIPAQNFRQAASVGRRAAEVKHSQYPVPQQEAKPNTAHISFSWSFWHRTQHTIPHFFHNKSGHI
jgi:hypothetical protein